MTETVELRRGADRHLATTAWLRSWQAFSYGDHYDPANTHHGVLLVCNEEVLAAGSGYDTHPHRDLEILTWVLHGGLRHADSLGHRGVIRPGVIQCLSAGAGVEHAEHAEQAAGGVHFVQMAVLPDTVGAAPRHRQADVAAALAGRTLVTLASGIPGLPGAIGLGNRHAALHGARLEDGDAVGLPRAPYLYLQVTHGTVRVDGRTELHAGDAIRFRGSDGPTVRATGAAEVLIWQMHTALGD
ncbi:pirin family protein [Mycolicibacillus parakoreensis]|uniref:Pirin family protein n=1 Tax=Mycolicibacillus parakoreensis TaxID=1069221 RepID=A0ABY3TZN5_9MYCO|nr:pirin family protein [Mycolicibacillus parakoreensis]MCV7316445.1 pirin family protein [Mycolicibacillus parakoreensis]ULN52682.1 pirin family protein [Mycolicibacillus parakoreensis]